MKCDKCDKKLLKGDFCFPFEIVISTHWLGRLFNSGFCVNFVCLDCYKKILKQSD